MVRLSELKSTVQNSRPVKTAAALPDDIITQREAAQGTQEEDLGEQEAEVGEAQLRRRKPARPRDQAAKAEPEEKFRGKRQKDFDLSEQNESSDEESQKQDRNGAAEEPWTQNQQKLLELALQQYPKGCSERWDKIAKCVPSKSKVGAEGQEGPFPGMRILQWLWPTFCSSLFSSFSSLLLTHGFLLAHSLPTHFSSSLRAGTPRCPAWVQRPGFKGGDYSSGLVNFTSSKPPAFLRMCSLRNWGRPAGCPHPGPRAGLALGQVKWAAF